MITRANFISISHYTITIGVLANIFKKFSVAQLGLEI